MLQQPKPIADRENLRINFAPHRIWLAGGTQVVEPSSLSTIESQDVAELSEEAETESIDPLTVSYGQ
jgi:hypothetical protein